MYGSVGVRGDTWPLCALTTGIKSSYTTPGGSFDSACDAPDGEPLTHFPIQGLESPGGWLLPLASCDRTRCPW